MTKTLVAAGILGTLIGAAAVSLGAQAQGQKFGAMFWDYRTPNVRSFVYEGTADSLTRDGSVEIYRGNVTISFPDGRIVIHADEIQSNMKTKNLALKGNVRID